MFGGDILDFLWKILRKEWSIRPDLILHASRHYEGAMQCFIRLGVITCSKWVNVNHQMLKLTHTNNFEWVKVTSPAKINIILLYYFILYQINY
jgi:hypothetical protein